MPIELYIDEAEEVPKEIWDQCEQLIQRAKPNPKIARIICRPPEKWRAFIIGEFNPNEKFPNQSSINDPEDERELRP